jgi:hypothetical protein
MPDNSTDQQPQTTPGQVSPNVPPEHHGILDQTLGEILHQNPQAQSIVMKSMNLTQEQFQQLLTKTDDNQLMNTKVRDLFSSGVVQQAVAMHQKGEQPPVPPDQLQITAEQAAQIQAQEANQQVAQQPQQSSLMQKIKGLLGL